MKYIGAITCGVISFALMLFTYAMNMFDTKELVILMLMAIPLYMYKKNKQNYSIAYFVFVALTISLRLFLNSILIDKLRVVTYPLTMEQHEIRYIAGIAMIVSLMLYFTWVLYKTASETFRFVNTNSMNDKNNQSIINNKKSYMEMTGIFTSLSLLSCVFTYGMRTMLLLIVVDIVIIIIFITSMNNILNKIVTAKLAESSNMEDADEVCE